MLGPLASQAAEQIYRAYQDYQSEFQAITQRAKGRFSACDWPGGYADAVERLELYKKIVNQTVTGIQQLLDGRVKEPTLWTDMKAVYALQMTCCGDFELAETFFNSITRRIFSTVGVNPKVEFIDSDFDSRRPPPGPPVYQAYPLYRMVGFSQATVQPGVETALSQALDRVLVAHPFPCGYQDQERDARLAARVLLDQVWQSPLAGLPLVRLEILVPEFYRNFSAFIIGRLVFACGDGSEACLPLVLCLRNHDRKVFIDAVLTDEDEVSIVFSFARSYFHVQVEQPYELVLFLKSIMPRKRIAELYIAIGYNKHGKTELYRELRRRLAETDESLEIARGDKGMVMAVFTLPSYDIVFKVIKDRILPPKATTRREVMERYDLVFKHDRAGRLVDAQEFEHLTFERSRFSEPLLAELAAVAPQTVSIGEDTVEIRHLYTERRLTPLNLYLKEAPPSAAQAAVIDYGQAIKDLAATNIFPGDVLLKNFGVTRHGRVVFYDYDELCHITDCKFRRLPQPRSDDENYEAEPWFYVGPMDIFPEEFQTFLGLQGGMRALFLSQHEEIFDFRWWKEMQKRHQAGELMDIVSYPEARRIRR